MRHWQQIDPELRSTWRKAAPAIMLWGGSVVVSIALASLLNRVLHLLILAESVPVVLVIGSIAGIVLLRRTEAT